MCAPICVYICICMCGVLVHVHVHIMQFCMYACMFVCMLHVHVFACSHIFLNLPMHTCVTNVKRPDMLTADNVCVCPT